KIDASKVRHRRGVPAFDCIRRRYVGDRGQDMSTGLLPKRVRSRFNRSGASRCNRNLRAFDRKLAGHGKTKPLARAANHCDLSLQPQLHTSSTNTPREGDRTRKLAIYCPGIPDERNETVDEWLSAGVEARQAARDRTGTVLIRARRSGRRSTPISSAAMVTISNACTSVLLKRSSDNAGICAISRMP